MIFQNEDMIETKMPEVKVAIIGYIDDAQPGWAECLLVDVYGHSWSFIEKAPVISQEHLDANSNYPVAGLIACSIIKTELDAHKNEVITIDTDKPWGVTSTAGTNLFDVHPNQLVDIN